MHNFLLDLWHDLREKRLWPVAVLLVGALVAVPFVLLEKGQPAPATPAPTATQGQPAADKVPTITLDEVAAKAPSNLTEFAKSQRNPFIPLKDLPAKDPGEGVTISRGTPEKASGTGTGSGSDTGSKPATGTGGTGGGAGSYVGPKTTYFAYKADIRFGAPGKEKTMKQVDAFTLLGDEKDPAAMFMGITDDHAYAVFAVDTTRYESNGEHECKPSEDRCEFVYLKIDADANETTLTSLDGLTTYNLELLAIKRVVLEKSDVENVPTEAKKTDDSGAGKRNTVDAEPRSLFDILARTR
jgi:hypothetical protein